jgi:very-short-patch-repair endonuclease
MTRSEVVLWQAVRASRLDGYKTRRQHPFGPYVLDFFCTAARLAIEVDGAAHQNEQQAALDHGRDRYLLRHGVRTLRVTSAEVMGDLEGVLSTIRAWIAQSGCPPLCGGQGREAT